MPRYYLHVHDGVTLIPDEDGLEFETLTAAEYAAARMAADIGLRKLPTGEDCQVIVEVRDERHQRVVTMTVSMRIDRLTRPPQMSSPWIA
jgi:hypothetical protein